MIVSACEPLELVQLAHEVRIHSVRYAALGLLAPPRIGNVARQALEDFVFVLRHSSLSASLSASSSRTRSSVISQ